MQWQRGFSLVEMLVAMVIGLILFAGLGQVFVTTKRTSITQEESALLQENSRYAAYLLAREVHHAGYLGCGAPANLEVYSSETFGDDFGLAIAGYEAANTAPGDTFTIGGSQSGSWSPALPATLGNEQILPGSDIVVIYRASGTGVKFSAQTSNGFVIQNPQERISQGCSETQDSFYGLCPGDIALVSDCSAARSFIIDSMTLNGSGDLELYHNEGWGGAGDPNINNQFNKDYSRLYTGYAVSYFIRNNQNNVPSLYRLISGPSAAAEEMIEGVENMQILYGIDSDGDGTVNRYVPASGSLDFSQVISLRMALLLRSVREIPNRNPPPSSPSWNLLATNIVTDSDTLLRKVLTITAQLRDQGN